MKQTEKIKEKKQSETMTLHMNTRRIINRINTHENTYTHSAFRSVRSPVHEHLVVLSS